MVSAWQEPPSVIPAEWSAEATAVGRCRRHSNQSLGLERRCHTVAYLGLLRLRPGPAREVFWTWPWEPLAACQSQGLAYSGDRMRGQVFRRSSSVVATSRAGHRPQRSDLAVQHRRWDRALATSGVMLPLSSKATMVLQMFPGHVARLPPTMGPPL